MSDHMDKMCGLDTKQAALSVVIQMVMEDVYWLEGPGIQWVLGVPTDVCQRQFLVLLYFCVSVRITKVVWGDWF